MAFPRKSTMNPIKSQWISSPDLCALRPGSFNGAPPQPFRNHLSNQACGSHSTCFHMFPSWLSQLLFVNFAHCTVSAAKAPKVSPPPVARRTRCFNHILWQTSYGLRSVFSQCFRLSDTWGRIGIAVSQWSARLLQDRSVHRVTTEILDIVP